MRKLLCVLLSCLIVLGISFFALPVSASEEDPGDEAWAEETDGWEEEPDDGEWTEAPDDGEWEEEADDSEWTEDWEDWDEESGMWDDAPDSGIWPEESDEDMYSEKARLIDAGTYSSAWIREDGTVALVTKLTDNDRKINGWKNVRQIAAYDSIAGLLENGRVVVDNIAPSHEPKNSLDPSAVKSWTNIVDIDVDRHSIVGLTRDGTVVVSNGNGETSAWTDIVDVAVNATNVYGLKDNGTVLVSGSHSAKQAKVSGWRDIIAIDACYDHVVGLKADGTVVAKGNYGCDVGFWEDIVAVSAGVYHTVGLRSDGTVVATMMDGGKDYGQCNVGGWTDVVAVSAGLYHTIAMQSDGTILAVGSNYHAQCEVGD